MGLHYVAVHNTSLDLRLVAATVLNGLSRDRALAWVSRMLTETAAESTLAQIALRVRPLAAAPPPGSSDILRSRNAGRA
jgi:hypothetical protein